MKLVLTSLVALLNAGSAQTLSLPSEDGFYLSVPQGTICEQQVKQQAQRTYNRCVSQFGTFGNVCERRRQEKIEQLMALCNDSQQCEGDAQRQYEAFVSTCQDDDGEACSLEGNQIRSQLKYQCHN